MALRVVESGYACQPSSMLSTRWQRQHGLLCPHRNSGLSIEEFTELHNSIKRGDIVGVDGFPGKSRNGELSIFPAGLQVL